MRHTPRDRLYERALRGRWNLFPVSPEPFYERLCNGLGEGFRSKGQTFKLARRLEAAIERLDRNTAKDAAERLAARRALVAWCYRAMERCDDSYGVIGELAREALFTYARLAFEPAGIAAEDWLSVATCSGPTVTVGIPANVATDGRQDARAQTSGEPRLRPRDRRRSVDYAKRPSSRRPSPQGEA